LGGDVTATVPYAAPEVLSGEASSEASDVYSLGATLHAALRGRAPYEARPDEAAIAVAVRVLSQDPPDLRDAGVPDPLASVIERAMARDVTQRYSTAADLRDALEQLDLDGPTEDAPPVPATTVMAAAPCSPAPPPGDTTRVAGVVPAPAPSSLAPERHRRPARGKAWVLVLLALLVAGVAAALVGLGDDGENPASPPTTTVEPGSTASPDAEPSAGAEPTTTAAAPAAEEPAPEPAAAERDPEEAVRSYYALMDAGRIDEGWARLSPAYQERTGEASYRGFWESVAGVEVLDAAGDGDVATATLRYTLRDGTTSTERVTLRFVPAEDGTLLIDDYAVG
jgi:serine/threonine-protein kinase